MSQFDDPRLAEVKRVLRRVQDIGEQSTDRQYTDARARAGSLPNGQQRSNSLSAALAAARTEPKVSMPPQPLFAIERAAPSPVGEQRVQPQLSFPILLATAVVCASAGVLTVFLAFPSISSQVANPGRPEAPPSVVMALQPEVSGPSTATSARGERKEALYSSSAASTPRLVAPTEWTAPAGAATSLPLSVEPAEEAANHHVLVSGLEASAFVIKGTEIIEGTWIVPATEFANAKVVRKANVPRKTSVNLELRTDAGTVVSRAQVILLAPSLAAGVSGAAGDR